MGRMTHIPGGPRRIPTPSACLPLLPLPVPNSPTAHSSTAHCSFCCCSQGMPFPWWLLWPLTGPPHACHADCPLTGHTSPTITQCQASLWTHTHTCSHTGTHMYTCMHACTHTYTNTSVCMEPAVCCPPPPHQPSLPLLLLHPETYFLLSINETSSPCKSPSLMRWLRPSFWV